MKRFMQEKKTYYESYTLILKVDMKHDENKMNKLNQSVSEKKNGIMLCLYQSTPSVKIR